MSDASPGLVTLGLPDPLPRLDPPFRLAGRRAWVAGHRGMVGAALVRRLTAEGSEVLSVGRETLDLRRQAEVEAWMDRNRPEVVFLAAAVVGFADEVVFDTSKPDGVPRKLLDSRRLAGLGWRATTALDEGIFKVRLARLTERQKAYARAMAEFGPEPVNSSDVANAMSLSLSQAAPIRDELSPVALIPPGMDDRVGGRLREILKGSPPRARRQPPRRCNKSPPPYPWESSKPPCPAASPPRKSSRKT